MFKQFSFCPLIIDLLFFYFSSHLECIRFKDNLNLNEKLEDMETVTKLLFFKIKCQFDEYYILILSYFTLFCYICIYTKLHIGACMMIALSFYEQLLPW